VLRFLATGSAGSDGSLTGRARRGLVLSRRNKRRAEERRNDKSRDCKFGSHQKTPKLVRMNPNLGHAILFRPMANIAEISYSKNSFVIAARASITFPNIRHLQNIGFAQSASNAAFAHLGIRSVRGRYREPSLLKMRGDDGVANHRA